MPWPAQCISWSCSPAWYFSQPNYAKGPDQMHAAPGFPAWLLFPIAALLPGS